ncbi:hypothetical protein Patl1_22796 [Pistacia atlantica]|uniref:Uncharacterized protein n=1 Tax=Pistacia atlantica TaxID=434234 RepID=A0ACC0ZYJ2_9ROSI|nr:hypothetical protein Patl1_22796 [Pistacia atlantica]
MDMMASMEARVMCNEVNVVEVKEHLDVLGSKDGRYGRDGRNHGRVSPRCCREAPSFHGVPSGDVGLSQGITSSSGRAPIGSRGKQGRLGVLQEGGGKTGSSPMPHLPQGSKFQDLRTTNVQSEQERVNIATGYLEDHAIAWWQRKHAEIVQGTCIINTWELLKCEIKKQFYPSNVAYEARKKMRELKHTRPISRYVDEFSKLMLQVDNMNSEDLLFNFMEGLQPWAQRELQRRQVTNISTALIEANILVEFRKGESSKPKKDGKSDYGKVGEETETNHPIEKRETNRLTRRNGGRMARMNTSAGRTAIQCDAPTAIQLYLHPGGSSMLGSDSEQGRTKQPTLRNAN